MTEPRVHLICNAHLDPIWQWDWEEGLTEAIATFEIAADLLDEYPEFVFNHNESLLYEWTRQYRPELFERIRHWVSTGRWVIAGGWYLQPDCNLPCGESFVRQALLGRRFFGKFFGAEPKVAYNFDPFGHHANMPQILRQCGYDMYVHFRPQPGEMPLESWLYRWEGIDGSVVTAMRPPCNCYNSVPWALQDKIEQMIEVSRKTGRDVTAFWGAGDHGGGATRADLKTIRRVMRAHPGMIAHSTLGTYHQAIQPLLRDLPLVRGELQKSFTGSYTSVIGTKQRNRRGEALALAAERYAALAWWLLGEPYPRARLNDVWRKVLFNQFHDILPGSSIREGYQSSAEIYGHAFTQAREVILQSQLQLLRTRRRRKPLAVCVFNPQARARRITVECDFMAAPSPFVLEGKTFRLLDKRGRAVPLQWLTPRSRLCVEVEGGQDELSWRKRCLFKARVPALGWAEYRLEMLDGHDARPRPAVAMRRERRCLRFRTPHYRLAIDRRSGRLSSLRDAESGAEYLARAGGSLLVREDTPDSWGPARRPYGKVVGRFRCPTRGELAGISGAHGQPVGEAVRVIEAGALATCIEIVQCYGRSVARLRYTLYAQQPEIGLEVLVNWAERGRALQLEFPTTLDSGRYRVEVPHGAIERQAGNDEEPCGRWIMLTGADRGQSLAIVNDGPGGVDVDRGVLRQTLVRSPAFCTMTRTAITDRLGEHMDLGEHILRFVLRCGAPRAVRADLPVLADDLSMPPSVHVHIPLGPSAAEGLVPSVDTVKVTGSGIHLAALKQSESRRALVARLVEMQGRKARATLQVPGLKTPVELAFTPFEIKTIRFEREKNGVHWHACDLLERQARRVGKSR